MTLYTIQKRRAATSSAWTTANPILEEGQWGIEINTGKAKLGDGATAWTGLPYFSNGALIAAQIAESTSTVFVMLESDQDESDIPVETPFGTPVFRKGESALTIVGASGCLDLANAQFIDTGSGPMGALTDGELTGSQIKVYFPDFPLTRFDRTKTYKWTITYNGSGELLAIKAFPDNNSSSWSTGPKSDIGHNYTSIPGTDDVYEIVMGAEAVGYLDYNGTPDTYEGMTFEFDDDSIITSICWEEFTYPPPPPTSGTLDLADALFNYDDGVPESPYGQYVGGNIQSLNGGISCYFPEFLLTELDRDKLYKFTFTFAGGSTLTWAEMRGYPEMTPTSWYNFSEGLSGSPTSAGDRIWIGDEVGGWGSLTADTGFEGLSFEWWDDDVVLTGIAWEIIDPTTPYVAYPLVATGAASITASTELPAVYGGSGYVQDDSDTTYVEVQREVVGHFGSGDDDYDSTGTYRWSLDSALSTLPAFDDLYYAEMIVRARVQLVTNDIEELYPGALSIGVFVTRASDGLALTSMGTFDQPAVNLTVGVTTWVDVPQQIIVESENIYNALRDGSWSPYGTVGLGLGWSSVPGETPTNDVGDRFELRVYEIEVEIRVHEAP